MAEAPFSPRRAARQLVTDRRTLNHLKKMESQLRNQYGNPLNLKPGSFLARQYAGKLLDVVHAVGAIPVRWGIDEIVHQHPATTFAIDPGPGALYAIARATRTFYPPLLIAAQAFQAIDDIAKSAADALQHHHQAPAMHWFEERLLPAIGHLDRSSLLDDPHPPYRSMHGWIQSGAVTGLAAITMVASAVQPVWDRDQPDHEESDLDASLAASDNVVIQMAGVNADVQHKSIHAVTLQGEPNGFLPPDIEAYGLDRERPGNPLKFTTPLLDRQVPNEDRTLREAQDAVEHDHQRPTHGCVALARMRDVGGAMSDTEQNGITKLVGWYSEVHRAGHFFSPQSQLSARLVLARSIPGLIKIERTMPTTSSSLFQSGAGYSRFGL